MSGAFLRIPDETAYDGFVDLHYRDMGSGDPVMVFIHGLGADLVEFEHQMEYFSQTRRCIAFDQRGFGETAPDGELSIERSIADFEYLIDKLGLDRFILVGHSMGSMVSYGYILRHPERVKRLIIIGGTAGIRESEITYAGLRILPRAASHLAETHRRWLVKNLALNVSMFSLIASPRIVEHYLGPNPKMFTGEFYDTVMRYVGEITRFDYRSELSRITCPVLIVHGGLDLSISVTAALNARRMLPNAKLRILPLCGHSPNVELPDTMNRIIEKFLRNGSA